MKKKIAGLVVTGALALTAVVGAATFAYFNDIKTSSANAIQAGELKLTAFRDDMLISGPMFYPDGNTQGLKPTGLWQPGKVVSRGLVIKNEGEIDSVLEDIYAVSEDNFTLNGTTDNDKTFTAFANQTQVAVYALTTAYDNDDWKDVSDIAAALEQADADVQAYMVGHTQDEIDAYMKSKLDAIASQRGSYWNASYLGSENLSVFLNRSRIWGWPDVTLNSGEAVYLVYQVRFSNLNSDQNINQGKNYKFTFAQEFKQAPAPAPAN